MNTNTKYHVYETAIKFANSVAEDWYFNYQYVDFNSLEQAKKEKLIDNLLSALAVLLAPYEYNKQSSKSCVVSPITAWFCSTYGWYYYSCQRDRIEKLHSSLLEAGYKPESNNKITTCAEKEVNREMSEG